MSQHSASESASRGSRAFSFFVICLLAGILVVQVLILEKMADPPVTLLALKNASSEQRRVLLQQVPLVSIRDGNVEVSGTVDVDHISGTVSTEVVNSVEVIVGNVPLDVSIYR